MQDYKSILLEGKCLGSKVHFDNSDSVGVKLSKIYNQQKVNVRDIEKEKITSLVIHPLQEWNFTNNFGDCSVTCGGGVVSRKRTCVKGSPMVALEPSHCGNGSAIITMACNTSPCAGKMCESCIN